MLTWHKKGAGGMPHTLRMMVRTVAVAPQPQGDHTPGDVVSEIPRALRQANGGLRPSRGAQTA